MGFISPRDRKGEDMAMPAQSHSRVKQASLFAHIGFSTCTWGCRAQQLLFFQLYFDCCDNRRLNVEQHYETSEIDVSIS